MSQNSGSQFLLAEGALGISKAVEAQGQAINQLAGAIKAMNVRLAALEKPADEVKPKLAK